MGINMTRTARTDQFISDFESHGGQKLNSLFRPSCRRIFTILVTVNLAFEAAVAGAAIHYVSPAGSPAPERDDPARPWQLVEAAAAALPPGSGELRLYPGVYREAMTLSRPCVLTTATVGSATIGNRAGVAATTSFNVFTWNTHLAGDEAFLPSWLDYTRASEMGDYLRLRRPQLDLVSLCEVWDEDLFLGGDGAQGIRPTAGYANGMHGTRVDNQSEGCLLIPGIPPTVLNSGLAMMTDHPMSDTIQVSFGDCDGSCPTDSSPDCLASKGFIVATVVKDGFTLRIYNTHTQAGNGGDAVEARQNQIDQMAAHISSYRNANPSHLVIVMGDLNVIGETADQYNFL